MIYNNSWKWEAFLHFIGSHLCPGEPVKVHPFIRDEGVYYLGGGYWRARPVYRNEDDEDRRENPIGVTLINPSLKWDQIKIVEQALAILGCGSYRENKNIHLNRI